jgi:hypothetical protein
MRLRSPGPVRACRIVRPVSWRRKAPKEASAPVGPSAVLAFKRPGDLPHPVPDVEQRLAIPGVTLDAAGLPDLVAAAKLQELVDEHLATCPLTTKPGGCRWARDTITQARELGLAGIAKAEIR